MKDQNDGGVSLKDDIASIRTNPTFHDVVLVCADGVEIGACRAILASRSAVFKAMFYGNMQESISGRVSLQDIKSTAMDAILQFIHTEDIDSNAVSVAVEVYRAASFFLLPKLMQLVFERAHDIIDLGVATSLLNDVTVSVPWNDYTEGLYNVGFTPFCTNPLAIGDLNGLSYKALERLLTTKTVGFKTSEYNLLLCVIEWAWSRDSTTLPVAKRRVIFDNINSLSKKSSIKIRLQSEQSRKSLLKLLSHFDLTLACPHRLKCLIKSVNVFNEMPQDTWAFCYQACENTSCGPAHPSQSRGPKLQWERSRFVSGLVFSEDDSVVESLIGDAYPTLITVRASTKCSADRDGLCEWTIVIESLSNDDDGSSDVGLVDESWNCPTKLSDVGWGFFSKSTHSQIFHKGDCVNHNYGAHIRDGDVVTFHLNLNSHTCALSVNGHNYGVAWRNLPHNVNLYPAVCLYPGSKYRIKPHQ